MTGQALIVQGDALRLPLPDASVDLVVTSPPFAFLRAYDTGYPHLEVGAEATPAEFLEHLWQATAEMVRVLKPTGSIFVDLGDSYYSGKGAPGATTVDEKSLARTFRRTTRSPLDYGLDYPRKSLMLLPERYRIGCVDQLGLIARAVIVWDKPNGLPESVADRVRRSHEEWVHLTRFPRYYAAIDEIREPTTVYTGLSYQERLARGLNTAKAGNRGRDVGSSDGERVPVLAPNPLGKLPGSVWSVPSEPLRLPDHLGVQHYAAFPSEWPRRLILAFSPPGICLDCEQGRVPVVESLRRVVNPEKAEKRLRAAEGAIKGTSAWSTLSDAKGEPSATILGYACACTPHTNHPGSGESSGPKYGETIASGNGYPPRFGSDPANNLSARPRTGPWREYHLDGWKPPPTRPAVILDPFSGTGTVPMVARALGRIGIGVDLSMPYSRAARWRVYHDAAKAISRTNLERQGSLL